MQFEDDAVVVPTGARGKGESMSLTRDEATALVLQSTLDGGGRMRESSKVAGVPQRAFEDLARLVGQRYVSCRSGCGLFVARWVDGSWRGDCPVCGNPRTPVGEAADRTQFRMQLRTETLRKLSPEPFDEAAKVQGRAKAQRIVEAVVHQGLVDAVLSPDVAPGLASQAVSRTPEQPAPSNHEVVDTHIEYDEGIDEW